MSIQLIAEAGAAGAPFHHFWNTCVGAGRAAEGLRASWLEHMELAVKHCGFRYVRFHGLFHDDMFVYRAKEGGVTFNFQYVDELFDRLLAIGIRPFVELGFCPGDLASEKGTVFWWKANGAPPTDLTKWAELVRRFVTHVIGRYGLDEVLTWYFEVWNEPNLAPFFRGTKSQYFELYKTSVRTIKAIEPRLRVGGPATSNFVPDARFDGETEDHSQHRLVTTAKDLDAFTWKPVWLEQFFAYCEREKLPVDFVSVHPYPTDWALDEHGTGMKLTRGVDATAKDLMLVRRMVRASAFAHAEIHLTEWSSSSSSRDFTHDYLQAATYVVKANVESIGQVDSLAYWTFTDVFEEEGAGDTAFHGGFGLINYQGIPKPAFHAYRFLNTMGSRLLVRAPGGIVTRHDTTGELTALAYHYPPEMPFTVPASFGTRAKAEETLNLGSPEVLTIDLKGLRPFQPISLETLARGAGDAMTAWRNLGSPEPLSREHTRALRDAAQATLKEVFSADAGGRFQLERPMAPWSVVLLQTL
jgi:xylan 1,4-beta-xylosidase